MSLKEQLKRDAEEMGKGGNDYFNFENKAISKIRILTQPVVLGQHFFGKGVKPSVCYGVKNGCPFHVDDTSKVATKYVCYVLDRADNIIKVADLPYTVVKKLASLEEDEDYGFQDYPMPYDIKVAFDKDKAPAEMYDINASPKREQVESEILSLLDEKMAKITPTEIVEKKKEGQIKDHKERGMWISPEELEKKEAERVALYRENLTKIPKHVDTVTYPDDNIDPEDIPF